MVQSIQEIDKVVIFYLVLNNVVKRILQTVLIEIIQIFLL